MKTLVLNSGYMPIGALEWERAFSLVYAGKAEAIAYYDKKVRSAHDEHAVPSVIRIQKQGKSFIKHVRFNKRNVFLRDGGKCAYCQQPVSYRKATYDHVKPKSKGGPTNWTNIVLCCQTCNGKKKDMTVEQAGLVLHATPFRPAPISALKAFIQRYKSKAPKAWIDWIPS